jgi:hypothetical protein
LQNELSSLAIEYKRMNQVDDKEELEALVTAMRKFILEYKRILHDLLLTLIFA